MKHLNLQLHVRNSTRTPIDIVPVEQLIRDFLIYMKVDGNTYLELHLVGNKRIQTLNRTHRGKDKPTDVLSFPILDPIIGHSGKPKRVQNQSERSWTSQDDSLMMLGAIVISLPFARDKKERIVDLVLHGILHLLGLDHETNTDAVRWESLIKQFWVRHQGSKSAPAH